MKRNSLATVVIVGAVLATTAQPADAQRGPIARQIIALGNKVALPAFRPAPDTVTESAQKVLPNALDKVDAEKLVYQGAPKPIVIEPRTRTLAQQNPQLADPDLTPADGAPARALAQTCLADLIQIARAKPVLQPASDDVACIVETPVELSATRGKAIITFPPGLVLDCPFALSFAKFAADVAQPLARFHLDQDIARITTGPGFTCRRRNSAPDGKLSEHALGKGVDIASFTLADNSTFGVQAAANLKPAQAKFQETLRQAACGAFTTVLGPGSNEAHATHIHLDQGRNTKKNPYRICE